MASHDKLTDEQRLRRAAVTAASRQPPNPPPQPDADDDEAEEDLAPRAWMQQQTLWVDQQVRRAMERGEFDNLPGAGKPIRGLGSTHDPDWWVKGFIEREQIAGVLPPALALRKEDAEIDVRLDREGTEKAVREVIDDFNRRVVHARRQLQGGPPVITPTRDLDAEVAAWSERRAQRQDRLRRQVEEQRAESAAGRPRRRRLWFGRG